MSSKDHPEAAGSLTKTLFEFHVYFQVRRILTEIQAPLAQDQAWNAFNNPYDRRAYERICSEFEVSSLANQQWAGSGLLLREPHGVPAHCGGRRPQTLRPSEDFVHKSDYQHGSACRLHCTGSWGVLGHIYPFNKSVGFSQLGVERLNDSIRTYVWAILGAQAIHPHSISLQPSIDTKTSYRMLAHGGLRVWNRPLHGPFGHASATTTKSLWRQAGRSWASMRVPMQPPHNHTQWSS